MKTFKLFIILILIVCLSGSISRADFTFGEAVKLGPTVNSSNGEYTPTFSAGGLELCFCSNRPGGTSNINLYVATRDSVGDSWKPAINMGSVVNGNYDTDPSLTSDDLELYFSSRRSGTNWVGDLFVTTREAIGADWGPPINLGYLVNDPTYDDISPFVTSDGLTLYFTSDRPGPRWVYDIWVSTRETINSDWGSPVALESPINSPLDETDPVISDDGLVFIFCRGGLSNGKLWMTTRRSKEDPWDEPQMLGSMVNIFRSNVAPDISSDGRWLIWSSSESGHYEDFDLWQAPILPIVDLNGDGIVDSADMCIMVDHWGTDNRLCDIGPMPWGDGIVDIQDLVVLAEHLFEEIPAFK